MNKYIQAIQALHVDRVEELLKQGSRWIEWAEPSGKNALHYLCAIPNLNNTEKAEASLKILKLLLKYGMDINSIQGVEDKNCDFPATPLWYAYTRGRNEKLYKYLLRQGANPDNCWWAISWYDDVAAGRLWLKNGAKLEQPHLNALFIGTFGWKRYKFAKWLLKIGADVNASGPHGDSALMLAVKRKDEKIIKLLLHFGANCNKKNDQGASAKQLAESKGPKRIAALFAEAPGKLFVPSSYKR